MNNISQVRASFSRSMRIFLRDKAIFGSSLFIPLFFLLILPYAMFQDVPSQILPLVKGYLVISMITLLIMTTGMSNLAGSIAGDRDHALYSKLASMPISPWTENFGRILTVIAFSTIGSSIIVGIGLLTGAELIYESIELILALGIGLTVIIASAGIGLLISCFVKSESAASHVGVAVVLFIYFIGIIQSYGELPELLKPIARIVPMSSGNAMITSLIIGEEFVGYSPLNLLDLSILLGLSVIFFVAGLLAYRKYCWQR